MDKPTYLKKNGTIKQPSRAFELNGTDIKKIATGAGMALAGGIALLVADQVQGLSDEIDFGMWEAISIAVVSTVVNALRKWAKDYSKES